MQFLSRAVLAVAFLLVALPATAQTRFFDVTGYYAWVDPQSDSRPGFGTLDEFELDSTTGFGAALNAFLTDNISAEFAVWLIDSETTVRSPLVAPFGAGDLEMMPITATLQYHFNPEGRIDPYIGAGVAYVLFDELSDFPNAGTDLRRIDVDDDFGWVANAGLSFDITPRLALIGDVKYVPVEAAANAVFAIAPEQNFELEVSPIIVSAGLSYQF